MPTNHDSIAETAASTRHDIRSRITQGWPVDRYPLKPWQAYLFTIVVTAATLGLRLALDGQLKGQPTLVMFTVPIMLGAYAGGLGAGLLATGMSYLLASYYLLPPIHSFQIASTAERWQQIFVVLTGVVISVVIEAMHRSRRRADIAVREHQAARAALVQAGPLQNAMFNSANFSYIATDARGVIQIFNAGAERMLGYTAAEVVNHLTPVDLHEPQEVVERAAELSLEFGTPIAPGFEALVFKAARGIEDTYEVTKIRKDRSEFPAMLSVTALRDPRDAIIGYLLIATDNTVRQQAEARRRASEARYRTLFEYAPDGIVIADSESYYVDANDSICRMLGYTRDELIGMHASNIVVETEVQHIEQALHVINGDADHHREWQFRRKDGSVFDADVIATKMPDGNLLGMIRDISDRKRFEQTLQQKNIELEGASRMKS
ncbi:MAG TPA: PAS domain S-box protein, partial [Gemmatimonadaceae bacterium]|nr:PAS domain S-box protein [Gemmatimonadaceae bacterium]